MLTSDLEQALAELAAAEEARTATGTLATTVGKLTSRSMRVPTEA